MSSNCDVFFTEIFIATLQSIDIDCLIANLVWQLWHSAAFDSRFFRMKPSSILRFNYRAILAADFLVQNDLPLNVFIVAL